MHIISVINNKGGVGKTTLVQNLGVWLASQGYTTVLVDFDSQANLSFSIPHTPNLDLATLILQKQPISLTEFCKTEYPNLWLLPNKQDINSNIFNQFPAGDQPFAFQDIIKNLKDVDFMLIDTAPSLDVPTFNTLIASDYVLSPVEYDIYSAMGLSVLQDNIRSAQRLNQNLQVLGILPTQVHPQAKLNKKMSEPLKNRFADQVFKTVVRTNVKFKQAQVEKTDIFAYEKSRNEDRGSSDIQAIGQEVIARIQKLSTQK